MSIDKQLHALIAERPRTKDELLAAIDGAPGFILMRIGYLVSKGRARWQGDQLVPHDGPGKPNKPRKARIETPPPRARTVRCSGVARWVGVHHRRVGVGYRVGDDRGRGCPAHGAAHPGAAAGRCGDGD
ncbi:MAG: hypothetical protein ACEQSH_00615 [Bacteroidia bacterium]